jgi:hypothetical protein
VERVQTRSFAPAVLYRIAQFLKKNFGADFRKNLALDPSANPMGLETDSKDEQL